MWRGGIRIGTEVKLLPFEDYMILCIENYLYVEFCQALLEIKREIKYTFLVMQRLRPPWWLSQ